MLILYLRMLNIECGQTNPKDNRRVKKMFKHDFSEVNFWV